MPVKIVELELSQGLQPVWGLEGYEELYLLVRYRGRPIGWICLPVDKPCIRVERLRELIIDKLGWGLMETVLGKQPGTGQGPGPALPPISVVVCVQEPVGWPERCLEALLALDYPDYEIIVVGNGLHHDHTVQLRSELPVRYVREEQPGLAWARNRGIAEARHDIVAFVDDRTQPERGWLRAIANAFAGSAEVTAVTGLVVPAELETAAQIRFESRYGLSRILRRRTIRRQTLAERELIWARYFGAGTNMAFRRHLFAEIGPFDVALGAGTSGSGSDDIEMLHRLVARGHTLVYEPAALVRYTPRRDATWLRQWVYGSGRSLGCYLLTCARNRTVSRRSILRFAVKDWLLWWILRRPCQAGKFPLHLIALELAGALLSPLAYSRAQAIQGAVTYRQPERWAKDGWQARETGDRA